MLLTVQSGFVWLPEAVPVADSTVKVAEPEEEAESVSSVDDALLVAVGVSVALPVTEGAPAVGEPLPVALSVQAVTVALLVELIERKMVSEAVQEPVAEEEPVEELEADKDFNVCVAEAVLLTVQSGFVWLPEAVADADLKVKVAEPEDDAVNVAVTEEVAERERRVKVALLVGDPEELPV